MSLIEGINDNFYKIIFDFKVTKTVFEKSSLIWRLQRWFYKNHVWSLHNFSLSNSLLCPHCHAFTLSWPSLYRSLCRDLRSLSQPPSCPWFCFFTLPLFFFCYKVQYLYSSLETICSNLFSHKKCSLIFLTWFSYSTIDFCHSGN